METNREARIKRNGISDSLRTGASVKKAKKIKFETNVPPEYKGWKFVSITAAAWIAITFLAIGLYAGMKLSKVYYVTANGKIHNQNCRYFKEIPDAKNCGYCGGVKH
mgnify:CR=1 FL=1